MQNANRTTFLQKYNPDYQREICHNVKECFFGDYPTLAELQSFSKQTPVMWLLPQLYDLSEYCGVKDKLQGKPIEETAFVIATEYYYLKISEVMLFFHRFKAGRYGRFYGNIDPLVITTSLLDFIKERNEEIAREESEQRKRNQTTPEERQAVYEQWCRNNNLNPEDSESPIKYFDYQHKNSQQ